MSGRDDSLADRLRRGEAEALAELLETQRTALLSHIERHMGTALRGKVEPQDVFQEVGIEALRRLKESDLSWRDPYGWLCRLAEWRIVDAHRRYFGAQKRSGDLEVPLNAVDAATSRKALIDLLVVTMTTPSQAFSREQRYLRLEEALASLPHEQREALRLRYFEGLPTKEIAQKLGKSDGAVRVMLSRALKRLPELLAPDITH